MKCKLDLLFSSHLIYSFSFCVSCSYESVKIKKKIENSIFFHSSYVAVIFIAIVQILYILPHKFLMCFQNVDVNVMMKKLKFVQRMGERIQLKLKAYVRSLVIDTR